MFQLEPAASGSTADGRTAAYSLDTGFAEPPGLFGEELGDATEACVD